MLLKSTCFQMESTLPEISQFLNSNSIQQQLITSFDDSDPLSSVILFGIKDLGLGEFMMDRAMKSEPGMENWCTENFGRISNYGNGTEFGKSCAIARTVSCPPPAAASGGKGKAVALSSATEGETSFKKRKADSPTVAAEEKPLKRGVKTDMRKDSNGNNKAIVNNQKGHPKENLKGSEVVKRDYIHVRARRGQATDSHSLAERVRREKIRAKMKYLQNLVPGCNKITGKAGMLDEIINYVQSLQRQVEFLSMKLAAITPSLDFGVENYLPKEVNYFRIPTIGVSSLGQGASSSGLGMGVDALDVTLRRTVSTPVSVPVTGPDSSFYNQIQHFLPDAELRHLYSMHLQQGRSAPFISDQPFTGFAEPGHVKLEEM